MAIPPNLYSAMLSVVDQVTTAVIPTLGIAPQQITVITRTWTGGRVNNPGPDGGTAYTDVQLALIKKFFIREIQEREIANSGGRYLKGMVEVSGIVPNHPANGPAEGYTESQLAPLVTQNGVEVIYRVTSSGGGAHTGDFRLVELKSADPWEWKLVLARSRTTPELGSPSP